MSQIEHLPRRSQLGRKSIYEALIEKRNVMHAVILRDVRTRFFNHGIGFLVVPLWPFVHLLLLLIMYSRMGSAMPYGDEPSVFLTSGIIPSLTFIYISRFMAISLLTNRSMLAFPVVSILDIVLARAFLEFIGSVLSIIMMLLFLSWQVSDPFPQDPGQALLALSLIMILALGVGMTVSVISIIIEPFAMFYTILTIMVYILSGALFVLGSLPEQYAQYLALNPVIHGVDWIRSAYYPGYPIQYLDKSYLAWCAFGSLFVGLCSERILRVAAKVG